MSLSSVDDDHVEGERLLGDQRALKVHHVGLRIEASRIRDLREQRSVYLGVKATLVEAKTSFDGSTEQL
ncbi:hypothetical protein T492DRAFT_979610 [Pavlovales sp. CCMP2436]|nr:hypothetical protein T492DRAFT_979610 [Pavlovales sp. CCMP2436]